MRTHAPVQIPCALCGKPHEAETLLEPSSFCPACLGLEEAEIELELVVETPVSGLQASDVRRPARPVAGHLQARAR